MFKDLKRHHPAAILMAIILICGSAYLLSDSMTKFPAHIHAWTQTDRLALAMNFQENGFDFFHPATYNLLTKDRITQVDFPIHDYLVAAISSLFNSNLVTTFRYYNLIYTLIGLFFFFRFCLLISKSDRRAIWATAFVFTLPVFVYYQNGFLPSVPSFANFMIAIYALFYYHKSQKQSHFYWAVAFFTLAALSRSPYFVFLFALLLQRVVLFIRNKKIVKSELFATIIGITAFIAYFLYNQYLAKQYGSMFLTQLLYIDSFATLSKIINTSIDRFGNEFLSPYHAIALIALLLAAYWQMKNAYKVNNLWAELMAYFTISTLGVLLFFLLMGKQFIDHDYYYLDTFYPLLLLLLPLALSIINIPKKWYTTVATLCIVFFFYCFSYAKNTQAERYTPKYNDRINYAYKVYKNAKADMQNWGVQQSDTLLVLDAISTNMPFTIFGSRGYTVLNSSKKIVKKALDSNFTYAVLIDSNFVLGSYKDYPQLIQRLKLLHSNGELSLYKKTNERNPANFFQTLHYYGESNFDDNSTLDSSVMSTATIEYTDTAYGNSFAFSFDREFGLTIKNNLQKLRKDKAVEVLILADYMPISDTAKVQLVCAHGDYHRIEYLENFITEVDKWQNRLFRFSIPANQIKQDENVTVYFWNPEQDNLYIDNYKILIYQ